MNRMIAATRNKVMGFAQARPIRRAEFANPSRGLFGAALHPTLAAIAELIDLAGKAITNVAAFNSRTKLLNVVAAGAPMGMI